MIHIAPVLVFVAALVPTLSIAADTCAPGQRRLNNGEPCIPEMLHNYLYCLSKFGEGKVEIVRKGDSSTTRGLEVNVSGKGSGVIFKGEGSGGSKQAEANRAVKEVSERIDPSLAKRCQEIAGSASPPTPPIAQNSHTSQGSRLGSTSKSAPNTMLNGHWMISHMFDGKSYPHDMYITRLDNGTIAGKGGYPAGGQPYNVEWVITGGSVDENRIVLTVEYTVGARGTIMHMAGDIAQNGSAIENGTWDDNAGGKTRMGTWRALKQ